MEKFLLTLSFSTGIFRGMLVKKLFNGYIDGDVFVVTLSFSTDLSGNAH